MKDIGSIINECKLPAGAADGPLTVLITDTNLDPPGPTILYAGGDIEALTGYRPEELIGKNPRILQGPSSDKQVLKKLRTCLENHQYFEGHTVNYRKDGTPMVMVWAVAPVFGENGEVLYFFSIHADGSDGAIQSKLCGVADKLDKTRCVLEQAGENLTRSAENIGTLLLKVMALRESEAAQH